MAVVATTTATTVLTRSTINRGNWPGANPTSGARVARSCRLLDHLVGAGEKRGRPSRSITTETLAKTVDQLDQHYKCSGCNPGKCPATRRMVFASRTGSRDIAHDRYLCIAV